MRPPEPSVIRAGAEKTVLILFVEYHASFGQSAAYMMAEVARLGGAGKARV